MVVTQDELRRRELNPLSGMYAFKRVLEADLKLCDHARRYGRQAMGILRLSESTLERELDTLQRCIEQVKYAEDGAGRVDSHGGTNANDANEVRENAS